MSAPLVYLCVRPQENAAAAEYESFRTATRLDEGDLQRWNLVQDRLPEDAFTRWRGFLVGGSPFNLTDPESSKTDAQRRVEDDLRTVARAAVEDRTAALFTCYSIGVLTQTLGGEVSRGFPEDTGTTVVQRTPEAAHDPLFGALAHRFAVLTAHKEGAGTVPPGATLLATNEQCPVQAYRAGERCYATQFHPEATTTAFTERMAIYRNDGYFAATDYDIISRRVLQASVSEPLRVLRAFASRF